MNVAVGIDLGTTNSCVAIMEDGQPQVIPNRGGALTTPSIVAIADNGKRLVGHIAKRQAITNAQNTVYAFKRLIGRAWGSDAVTTMADMASFRIVEGPHNDVRVQMRDRVYSVPEISSFILQEMRMIAEDKLGREVSQAVVTVPAYFNDNQRQATKDAGRIAGLEVLRIINEPTAAALAYGFGKDQEKRIAVYDLGGGTFDISILEIGGGVFEVICTSGDTFLGGEDFDARIIEWMIFEFARENKIDLRQDSMALQRLKDAAEKAKCELSTVLKADINLPFIISTGKRDSFHLQSSLTREKLEDLTSDLVERTVEICDHTLRENGIRLQEIDEVILVGGQTRMPLVIRSVEEYFGKGACKGVHPDVVVAMGAAIQASALLDHATSDVLLLDVTPHSLGIMIVGGLFNVIIELNTTVPCSKSHIFTTIKDNQTQVRIMVFQGESEQADENELLGEFIMTGLRPAAKGEVEIEVTFEISADGIVSVAAKDLETGQAQSITVTASSGLTEDEIQAMMQESQEYLIESKESEEVALQRMDIQKEVSEVERLFPKVEEVVADSAFGQEAMRKARSVVERAKKAVSSQDAQEMLEAKEALQRTLTMFRGVVSKVANT